MSTAYEQGPKWLGMDSCQMHALLHRCLTLSIPSARSARARHAAGIGGGLLFLPSAIFVSSLETPGSSSATIPVFLPAPKP